MFDPKKYYRISLANLVELPLKQFGFKFFDKNSICRMTDDEVFQSISFIKSRYGGENFKVAISIRPMYCPHADYLPSLPGNSLRSIATKSDENWNYSTETDGNKSFKEIVELIDKYAIPIFNSTENSFEIISCYERNIFGQRKFGNKIIWGTQGWENFDFGHIYLRAGDKSKSIRQFKKCYREFSADKRDWAQIAAKDCLKIIEIIKQGDDFIKDYLVDTIKTSKENLKLEKW